MFRVSGFTGELCFVFQPLGEGELRAAYLEKGQQAGATKSRKARRPFSSLPSPDGAALSPKVAQRVRRKERMSLATISGRRWSLQVQRALMVTAVMGLQWGLTTQAMEVIWRVAIDERPVWELAGLDGGPPPEWNFPALRPGSAMSSGDDSDDDDEKESDDYEDDESKR